MYSARREAAAAGVTVVDIDLAALAVGAVWGARRALR